MIRITKLNLAFIACFAMALCVFDAKAQGVLVQVPADTPKGPQIAFYCRIQIPTEGGRYYAGRTLDSEGHRISDSIGWQDAHAGDKDLAPQVDIKWWSENAPHSFNKGVVNFLINAPKPVGYYLQVHFDHTDKNETYTHEAGPLSGGPEDNRAISFFPVGEFMAFAQDTPTVHWTLEYRQKYQGPIKGKHLEGEFLTAPLHEARKAFGKIIPALDAKQTNFKSECTAH